MTPHIVTPPLPGTTIDPLYPDSDGRPVGETDYHYVAMDWLREALKDYFAAAGRDDVYVGSNLLLYYEEANPAGYCGPDVLVAKGVGNHYRRSFRVWEEKTTPQVVFEIASKKTWRKDVGKKRELYERLGVAEYFLFDPEGVWLDPRLQGFHLENGVYVPLRLNADSGLTSAELGLRFTPEAGMLRLSDVQTGAVVLTRSERADEERDRAEEERDRADKLATEVARLKALLAKSKRKE